jgi:tetratricopeptide (TPR) repeat protein
MSLLNLKVYIIIKYLGKLVEWKAAIKAFNDKNMEEALDRFCVRNKTHFKAIADQAKMHYNISICCCNLFDYEKANVALGKAIEADPYFALAFYQRGWINTQLGRHSNALKDYISAYKVRMIF